MEYTYEEEEGSDVDRELRPLARRTGKHIAAGEERPRINSSQQTTPTEGKLDIYRFFKKVTLFEFLLLYLISGIFVKIIVSILLILQSVRLISTLH